MRVACANIAKPRAALSPRIPARRLASTPALSRGQTQHQDGKEKPASVVAEIKNAGRKFAAQRIVGSALTLDRNLRVTGTHATCSQTRGQRHTRIPVRVVSKTRLRHDAESVMPQRRHGIFTWRGGAHHQTVKIPALRDGFASQFIRLAPPRRPGKRVE